MAHEDGVAGADALGVVEDALHKRDVEVGHLEHFPLLVRREPEAFLDGDWADGGWDDGVAGVVCRDGVRVGGVDDAAGVVYCYELGPLDGPEVVVAVDGGKAAEEVEPPGEELAFVGVVQNGCLHAWSWLAFRGWLCVSACGQTFATVVLTRRIRE